MRHPRYRELMHTTPSQRKDSANGTSRWAILAIAVLPFVYYLAATFCAWDFFRRRSEVTAGFSPPVSVLKPLQGLEHEAYENLASFCRQDYPEYEILFAVDDERDPAIPVIEKLISDFPSLPIRLLVGQESLARTTKWPSFAVWGARRGTNCWS